MKVLILTNELKNTCGVTSHLYNLSIGLIKNNVDLTIACSGGESVNKFRSLGVNTVIIQQLKHERRNLLNYLTAHIKLFMYLKNNKYDIVHSHHHYCANIAKNVCGILNIKTVQTNHGILPRVGRLKHFAADYYISVNDHINQYMIIEEMISGERISVIYYGIWETECKTKETHKKIRFIAAARLVEEKGIQDYINAVHLLEEKYFEQAEFFFGGEGEYEPVLRKINDKLGGKIIFLGNIINLNMHLDEFDVFVMTSKSKSEGLPMSIIEAAFNKNLIITSNFVGLSYYFTDGVDGIIFENNDIKSLSEKIMFTINNYEDLTHLSLNYHQKAKIKFNAERMVNNTIKLYKSIIR
jgi:glycosyltransferase involved in cell wall biosynthesis